MLGFPAGLLCVALGPTSTAASTKKSNTVSSLAQADVGSTG